MLKTLYGVVSVWFSSLHSYIHVERYWRREPVIPRWIVEKQERSQRFSLAGNSRLPEILLSRRFSLAEDFPYPKIFLPKILLSRKFSLAGDFPWPKIRTDTGQRIMSFTIIFSGFLCCNDNTTCMLPNFGTGPNFYVWTFSKPPPGAYVDGAKNDPGNNADITVLYMESKVNPRESK